VGKGKMEMGSSSNTPAPGPLTQYVPTRIEGASWLAGGDVPLGCLDSDRTGGGFRSTPGQGHRYPLAPGTALSLDATAKMWSHQLKRLRVGTGPWEPRKIMRAWSEAGSLLFPLIAWSAVSAAANPAS
jgi:hypothetical protein